MVRLAERQTAAQAELVQDLQAAAAAQAAPQRAAQAALEIMVVAAAAVEPRLIHRTLAQVERAAAPE